MSSFRAAVLETFAQPARRGVRPCQVGIEQPRSLVLVSRHEVTVTVEGDRDVRVPHVRAEGLGVHAGGDHQDAQQGKPD